jgi:hypothetical protein
MLVVCCVVLGAGEEYKMRKKKIWLDFCLAASAKHRVIDVVQGLGERHGVVVVKVWRTTPTRRKVVVFGRGGGLACFLRETVSYLMLDCWRPHIRHFDGNFTGQHDSMPRTGEGT